MLPSACVFSFDVLLALQLSDYSVGTWVNVKISFQEKRYVGLKVKELEKIKYVKQYIINSEPGIKKNYNI